MSKHKVKVEKDTAERWLLTYADLMNLLLIFFIVLYSYSQVDTQKFDQLAGSLRSTFGAYSPGALLPSGGAGSSIMSSLKPSEDATPSPIPSPSGSPGTGNGTLEEQNMAEIKAKVATLIEDQKLKDSLKVGLEERGVVISITANLLFKSGNSEIEKDSAPLLNDIGKILLAVPGNHIRVEGHTDNDPISTPFFPSNWELSSSRATNVLRLLIDKGGLNPRIISAVGYGEFRPMVPNTSDTNKAKNRRVDIVIIKSIYDVSEAPKQ